MYSLLQSGARLPECRREPRKTAGDCTGHVISVGAQKEGRHRERAGRVGAQRDGRGYTITYRHFDFEWCWSVCWCVVSAGRVVSCDMIDAFSLLPWDNSLLPRDSHSIDEIKSPEINPDIKKIVRDVSPSIRRALVLLVDGTYWAPVTCTWIEKLHDLIASSERSHDRIVPDERSQNLIAPEENW